YSVFETNTNGQYQGTLIHPETERSVISGINLEMKTKIGTTALLLKKALKDSVYAKQHRGFLGIDAMIFREKEGLKIQPCIEINSRMNMGILTTQIEKKIHDNTTGKFALYYGTRGEFKRFADNMTLEHPIKISNGKLSSGFLSLIEPDTETQFGAYFSLTAAR
ncbi:MAG: hypothetical protein Q8K69_13920, partial [Bacteroidota bacterium]|nr:hypothetical protein [Bacteroidota bacterium]